MTARDMSQEDFEGLEYSHQQRVDQRRWLELEAEQEPSDGNILDALRWLFICTVFVGFAAFSAYWGVL